MRDPGQLTTDEVGDEEVDHEDRLGLRADGLTRHRAGEDSAQHGEAGDTEDDGEDAKSEGHGKLPETWSCVGRVSRLHNNIID